MICISGTHSTGKTTLLQELSKEFPDLVIVPSTTRQIQSKGFKINEQGGDDTQLGIVSLDIINILSNRRRFCLCDRGILDTYIYTLYLFEQGQVSKVVLDYVEFLYKRYILDYSLIIYLVPEFSIVEDGVRSVNLSFQTRIFELFEEVIKELPIFKVTGTVEQRVSLIKTIICQ